MKKFIITFVICMFVFSITVFGTTISTTKQLKSYLENSLKTGVKQVKFTTKLTLNQIGSTFDLIGNNGYEYSYAKHFSYVKSGSNVTIKFDSAYSQSAITKMNADLDKQVQRIVNQVVKPGMTPYQKELALHDYLVNTAQYDTRVYTGKLPDLSYTAYGALLKKLAVCEGYAKAMSLLLKKAGISSIFITGTGSGQPHAWNLVKLDGAYYHMDATFDDPISQSGQQILSHNFFNRTDEQMRATHSWPSKFPKATGTKYAYQYETELADATLIKTADALALELESAVLNRQTSMTVRVFQFNEQAYDLIALLDQVMENHAELSYSAYCQGYTTSTLGEITTLTVQLDYLEKE